MLFQLCNLKDISDFKVLAAERETGRQDKDGLTHFGGEEEGRAADDVMEAEKGRMLFSFQERAETGYWW